MGSWIRNLLSQVATQLIAALVLAGFLAGGLVIWGLLLKWPGPLLAVLAELGMGGMLLTINQASTLYQNRKRAISDHPDPNPAQYPPAQNLPNLRLFYALVHDIRIRYPIEPTGRIREYERMLQMGAMPAVPEEDYATARRLLNAQKD